MASRLRETYGAIRTPVRLLTLVQGFGITLGALAMVVVPRHAHAILDVGGSLLSLVGVLCLLARLRDPRQFVPWLCSALAVMCAVLGGIPVVVAHPSVGYPVNVVFAVFGVVAAIAHLRHRMERRRDMMVIDILAFAGIVTAVTSALLPDVSDVTGLSTGDALARLLYPMSDMVVVGAVLSGVALLGRVPDRQLALLSLASVTLSVGDLVSSLNSGDFAPRSVISEVVAPVSMFLLCLAACLDAPARDPRPRQGNPRLETAVPLAAGATALALLSPLAHQPLALPRWVALVTLVLVGARMVLAGRELGHLLGEREEIRTDHLTGLANRVGMVSWLAATVQAAETAQESSTVALLVMDVDQFKEVNDSLGHERGDAVISALGQRLNDGFQNTTTRVARMGGDEFAVLITDDADPDTATAAAQRIAEMMHELIEIDGTRLQLEVSIGVVVADPAVTAASDMLRRADIAMYRAKVANVGHVLYDPTLVDPASEDRLRLLGELRHVLTQDNDGRFGALEVFYQPKVELRTGRVTGAEALVRWRHRERGLLFPDVFLPLAAEAGLMPRVTDLVLSSSLDRAASWQAEGRRISVAVNLPPAAVVDADLPGRVATALADRGLPASALVLEITEESLLSDRVRARGVLARLREMGVAVSIDDYGTGYSSLAYLRELPVDELKLDRSFVTPMALDDRAAAIVRSTVDLAHSLGLRIVAEGVEHGSAADQLGGYGCDHAQGYHYARPLPAREFEAWLRSHDAELGQVPGQRGAAGSPVA